MNRDELIDEVNYLHQDIEKLTAQLQKAEQDKAEILNLLKDLYTTFYKVDTDVLKKIYDKYSTAAYPLKTMENINEAWLKEAEKLGKNMFGDDFILPSRTITPREMQIYQRVKGFEQGATAYK